jgi:hypothetical protein
MKKHNKKRNTGIVYEQLLRYITEQVVDNKNSNARKAVKIIERRFKKGTELYKEFRLMNALVNSTVSGTHIAAGILSEAKRGTKRIDNNKLEKEKSLLVKDINYQLKETNFYHKEVKNFKLYATVQTLLNEWRDLDNCNLQRLIEYENKIVEHLIDTEKSVVTEIKDPQADRLVVNILADKINEKYNSKLTQEQKDIVRNYAIKQDNPASLKAYLQDLKTQTINLVENYRLETKNNVLLSKIDAVYEKISQLQTESVSDEDIKKFLIISSLKDQILRSEK